ncbi:hypothetical protein [Caldicellulosiruptor acetigenus]|uniref:hypothetical protein n=1 Tax=Caldicellulosiruptor acetigenus TaxID=301953 RepID=UPI0002D36D8A|nr:hypothetical protein [Caldicellulosiruptor acetigenus]
MNTARGEIWIPTRGHERSSVRSPVIISVDEFNPCPANLATIVLTMRTSKNIP